MKLTYKEKAQQAHGGGDDDQPEPFRGVTKGAADPQIAAAKAARERDKS